MQDRYSLKEIEAFVKVIRMGSFKDVARELNITQSALTQRLKKLEDALGARLIDRTTRSVAPTAVGSSFLPAAERLLRQFDQSVADLEDFIRVRRGRVTIASLISIATHILPGAIAQFSKQHPEMGVRVLDDSEREIAEYVRRGEAEFAVDMRTDDADEDPDLKFTPVMQDQFVVACRKGHPLAKGGAVAWEKLAGLPVIVLGQRSGTSRILDARLPKELRRHTWRYEVQHLSTMIGFVEAGLGVGIVPVMVMRAIRSKNLVHRLLISPELGRTISIVERRGATLSPAADQLKALLLNEFLRLGQAAF